MSNTRFDSLHKQIELKDALEALSNYKKAFSQPNLPVADYEFLSRAIGDSERRVAQARQAKDMWWC